MTDPNLTYKAAWRELREKLGRLPTTSDSEYWQLPGSPSMREGKKEWQRQATTAPTTAMTAERGASAKDQTPTIPTTGATIAGPSFSATNVEGTGQTTMSAPTAPQASENPVSREQAPQAGVYAREGEATAAEEALSGPGASVIRPGGVRGPGDNSEPVRAAGDGTTDDTAAVQAGALLSPGERLSQDLSSYRVGARGPNGGMVAKCEGCGELWEREKKRGRPAYKCPTCR